MIELDKHSFCGLSTSNIWHNFLYNLDPDLYKDFNEEMQNNRGCQSNRRTMERMHSIIMGDQLKAHQFIEFIKKNFPFMIKITPKIQNTELDKLFSQKLLTYPRRAIVYSNLHDFLSNKLKFEVFNDTEKYYVEYLEKSDMALLDKIPDDKWILRKYNSGRENNG